MAAHPTVWSLAPHRWLVKLAITWHGSHPGKRQQQQQQQPLRARGMLTQHTWLPTPHWKRPSISITYKTHMKKTLGNTVNAESHYRRDNTRQKQLSRLKVSSYTSLLIISSWKHTPANTRTGSSHQSHTVSNIAVCFLWICWTGLRRLRTGQRY